AGAEAIPSRHRERSVRSLGFVYVDRETISRGSKTGDPNWRNLESARPRRRAAARELTTVYEAKPKYSRRMAWCREATASHPVATPRELTSTGRRRSRSPGEAMSVGLAGCLTSAA